MAPDGRWPTDGPAPQNANVASSGGSVGQQIGSIGVQIVHSGRGYLPADNSPEELFRTAKAYLDAGAFTEASYRFDHVVARGHFSSEVRYYWALAILRGRPFDQLETEDFEKLRTAFAKAAPDGFDPWSEALWVVKEFVECLVDQGAQNGVLDAGRFQHPLGRYRALPSDRREEIGRHLGMMLHGPMQDLWDADLAEEIRAGRMSNDRRRRVPLFFEPDPIPPRRIEPLPSQAGLKAWATVLAGSAGTVAGGTMMFHTAFAISTVRTMLAVLLCMVGLAVAVPVGLEVRYLARRRAVKEQETIRAAPRAPTASTGFAGEIGRLIDQRFEEAFPVDPRDGDPAPQFVAARKASLRHEVVGHYAPDTPASQLDWLIRWHAYDALRQWRTGRAFAFRYALQPPGGDTHRLTVAAAAATLGTALGLQLAGQADKAITGIALVLLVLGGRAVWNGSRVYDERRRWADDEVALAERYEVELEAFHEEQARLAERPEDHEMARWLDYDKDYLRTQAMKKYTLESKDVISHFILTEPADGCRTARLVGGPPRCSAYRVRLFLLTHRGIREIELHLDFVTGAENNERRTVFRYNAIASVDTKPSTVRPRGRRQVASPEGGGPTDRPPRPILRHSLRITLLNGNHIDIRTDYDDLLPIEHREDDEALYQLAEDTSGANVALRILESVAAEGHDWVKREKQRITTMLSEYQLGG